MENRILKNNGVYREKCFLYDSFFYHSRREVIKMKQFSVVPKITMFETCDEFQREYQIGEHDLVFTIEVTWQSYFADVSAGTVIYIEQYGQGEPTDEMIEAICADIKKPYTRVIAIGGGTVLDCAKLFALKQTLPVTDLFDKKIPAVKRDVLNGENKKPNRIKIIAATTSMSL